MKIPLSEDEISILISSLYELGGSKSTNPGIKVCSGLSYEEGMKIVEDIKSMKDKGVDLDIEMWKKLYQLCNAVIYALGEPELQTITGYNLYEFANLNKKLYTYVYEDGRLGEEYLAKYRWDKSSQ